MNIAMWSGPRNLSTAMMYAFGSRSDFDVWDEPFYASYLHTTGLSHPMQQEIIAHGEIDPGCVARQCAGAAPNGRAHFYQKHMTHHMIDGIDRSWFGHVRHVFLIRHPARVLASYARKRENPTLSDIGFVQQAQIFDEVRALGDAAVVVDSHDILMRPKETLRTLCDALGVPFDPAMLAWPSGGHARDGVWAAHWYDAVHRSTGFSGPEGPLPQIPAALDVVMKAAMPSYHKLQKFALSRAD